jgi:hypothetical protein
VQGNILYRFPSLQITAGSRRTGRKEYVGMRLAQSIIGIDKYFNEQKWQFRFQLSTDNCLSAFSSVDISSRSKSYQSYMICAVKQVVLNGHWWWDWEL